jgi:hypothetical protein
MHSTIRVASPVVAIILLAGRCVAQEAGYQTEASASFGYEGGKTERPLVVVNGFVSPAFAFRGDSTRHDLLVAATRSLCPVPDDGATPLELLSYVARSSTLSASFALGATSSDSYGLARGMVSTVESRFTADRSDRGGRLAAEWFFERSTSVRASGSTLSLRETADSRSTDSPSGVSVLGRFGTRSSSWEGSLGVVRRFGDASVAVDGTYGTRSLTRDEDSLLSGGTVLSDTLDLEEITRSVTLSGRVLLLSRRLAVDVALSYGVDTSNLDETAPEFRTFAMTRTIHREAAGAATFYPLRRLGVGAVLSYGTDSAVSGFEVLFPASARKSVTYGVRARFFPRARASAELTASRTEVSRVEPPEATTFQRFTETHDRVTLTGSIRF